MDNVPNKNQLQSLFAECDILCDMSYMYEMHNLDIYASKLSNSEIGFIKIDKFPECEIWYSFCYVLNSFSSLGSSLGYIFTIDNNKPIIYIGISSNLYLFESLEIIYKGLLNIFPNISPSVLTPTESETLISKVFSPDTKAISSVSTIPGESQVPILNNFNQMMGTHDEFYLLLLATPCPYSYISQNLSRLRQLSSSLTQFSIENRSFSHTLTKASSAGSSNSLTCTNGHSHSLTDTCGSAANYAEYTNFNPSTSVPVCSKTNVNVSLVSNQGKGHNNNTSNTCTKAGSDSDTKTNSSNDQSSTNLTESSKLSFIFQNKTIINSLERIEKLILRFQSLTSYSSMNFCAYVLSPQISSTAMASNIYLGCSNPPHELLPMHTNMWTDNYSDFDGILESLKHFTHPSFTLNNNSRYKSYLASNFLNSNTSINGISNTSDITPSHIISTSELMKSLYFI